MTVEEAKAVLSQMGNHYEFPVDDRGSVLMAANELKSEGHAIEVYNIGKPTTEKDHVIVTHYLTCVLCLTGVAL